MNHLPSLLLALLTFLISLLIAMAAAAEFTRRLEAICEALAFPPSLLSLLGALGANIPNYMASIVAITGGRLDEGLGIIIGSNIYNIAIILAISTFATPRRHSIILTPKQASDAYTVAGYTLAIMLSTLVLTWLLPGTPLTAALRLPPITTILLVVAALCSLILFGALAFHAFHREHHPSTPAFHISRPGARLAENTSRLSLTRWIAVALLALVSALWAVIVMVQAGQNLTGDLGIPPLLAGLLVLAVATSLPNTVVAYTLARTGRETACVEEVFSSNSINAALGLALPLLFVRLTVHDQLLLVLDAPLMVALTLAALLCVQRMRISQLTATLLLLAYVVWVGIHVMI